VVGFNPPSTNFVKNVRHTNMENSQQNEEQINITRFKKYRKSAFAVGIIILWLIIYLAVKHGFIKS